MASTGRRYDAERSPEAQVWRRFYNSVRWKGPNGVRAKQLAAEPLCRFCRARGRTTPATVCDHIDPNSKKTEAGFFAGPFQSLCDDPRYRCHSSRKQQQETSGFSRDTGADGMPTDPNHPFNRG